MISDCIKSGIENSPLLKSVISQSLSSGKDINWSDFKRTQFDRIARRINQEVTTQVITNTLLAKDYLLIGEDEMKNILFKNNLKDENDFISYLKSLNSYTPYTWISGKTLESYWNNGRAKFKKLNVLLVFIGVNQNEWDDWKFESTQAESPVLETKPRVKSDGIAIIRKYFLGQYFRYYQKYTGESIFIKAPLIIEQLKSGEIVGHTKTMGHNYTTSHLSIRNGILYFDFENLDWDDRESHIYNVGLETHAEILVGVSTSLNRRGEATALKNILVRQHSKMDYNDLQVAEINLEDKNTSKDDLLVINYLKNSPDNTITTRHSYSLSDLENQLS